MKTVEAEIKVIERAQRVLDDENRVVGRFHKWTAEGTVKGKLILSIL
ncbi:MAG: hypothetical protein PUF16_08655 [Lachnospiraceae bacterium]|nr:hypothetical protein [Lachnospiraceae bacterium]